ncbi:MAG: hypothetical protein IPQ06_15585 [Chitinophagaceae bacterium]|nr:hypothetical protein [Chitinophagaceae bacterium]
MANWNARKSPTPSSIVAWFTTASPVSAGPAEYQGQLPGLIWKWILKTGTQIFIATAISEKAGLAGDKRTYREKHLTLEEFKKKEKR